MGRKKFAKFGYSRYLIGEMIEDNAKVPIRVGGLSNVG